MKAKYATRHGQNTTFYSKKQRQYCRLEFQECIKELVIPVRTSIVREEAAESVSERRHVMQVVNDNDSRRRTPAAGPGSDVIVGRGACALLDDVRQVLTQFTG